MKKIKITQVKSVIKRLEKQKRTIQALGLGRPNN
ncbi:MAG: 50S ribosomal protein L30, partial [Chlorobi bacterium]|nr:50S ribosomal protein L30 [Chlorobiota bacterium]